MLLRQLAQLITTAHRIARDGAAASGATSPQGCDQLQLQLGGLCQLLHHIDARLQPTWDWLLSLMDSTESQLRFGRELNQLIESSSPSASTGSSVPGSSSGGSSNSGSSNAARSRERGVGRTSLAFIRDPITSALTRRRVCVGESSSSNSASRRDAVSYVVSLLRANANEHCDTLPELDVSALKHVAYAFDALIAYLRCCESEACTVSAGASSVSNIASHSTHTLHNQCNNNPSLATAGINAPSLADPNNSNDSNAASLSGSGWDREDEAMLVDDIPTNIIQPPPPGANANTVPSVGLSESLAACIPPGTSATTDSAALFAAIERSRHHCFFQRSQSTLCLGSGPPDVFTVPLIEALPLAEKPHLLQPNARREDLWGRHNTYTHNTSKPCALVSVCLFW